MNKTNFNNYFRTVDEFKKPFESPDSPVVKAGLQLVSIETKITPCPYKEKWLKEKGDAKEHAKKYVESLRQWSNSTFLSGNGSCNYSAKPLKALPGVKEGRLICQTRVNFN